MGSAKMNLLYGLVRRRASLYLAWVVCLVLPNMMIVAAFFPVLPKTSGTRGSAYGTTTTALAESYLRGLIDDIQASAQKNPKTRQTIFVGGKGGVGKVRRSPNGIVLGF